METIRIIFSPQNKFFSLADHAKRLPHIALSSVLLPLFFLLGGTLLAQFVIGPILMTGYPYVDPFMRTSFTLFIMFGLIAAIIFLWVRFVEGRPIYTLGFTRNGMFKKYISGLVTGVLMFSVVVGIIALFDGVQWDTRATIATGMAAWLPVSILFLAYLVQGASEEILARGWYFQVVGKRYKPWLGALLSSVFFTAVHLGNAGVNITSVLNLLLFSTLMILFVLKDGSIWRACGWHSAWNWTQANVFGLEVSGTQVRGGTIIDLSTAGPELVSGGGFGPEGSLITTFIILIAITYWIMLILKKSEGSSDSKKETPGPMEAPEKILLEQNHFI